MTENVRSPLRRHSARRIEHAARTTTKSRFLQGQSSLHPLRIGKISVIGVGCQRNEALAGWVWGDLDVATREVRRATERDKRSSDKSLDENGEGGHGDDLYNKECVVKRVWIEEDEGSRANIWEGKERWIAVSQAQHFAELLDSQNAGIIKVALSINALGEGV